MNNKSKQDLTDQHELAAATADLASLEAASVESAENADWHQLGQLVRESAELELPPADPELRATLMAKLDGLALSELACAEIDEPGQTVALSGKAKIEGLGGRHNRWVLSIVALLTAVVGGGIWVSMQLGSSHLNFKTASSSTWEDSAAAIDTLKSANDSMTEKEQLLASERTIRAMRPTQLESKLMQFQSAVDDKQAILDQTAMESPKQVSELRAKSSRTKNESSDLPGEGIWDLPEVQPPHGNPAIAVSEVQSTKKTDELMLKLNEVTKINETKKTAPSFGLTVELPPNSTTNESTVLSVPEGGTVLMGGIKRVAGKQPQSPEITNWQYYERAVGVSPGEVRFRVAELDKNSSEGFSPTDDAGGGFASGGLGVDVDYAEKLDRRRRFEDLTYSNEQYDAIVENSFLVPQGELAFSTFSIDVDTASYSNMRRFITAGQRPPANSVRIEELVNYFPYDYAEPTDGKPFAVQMEMAACPWQPEHHLVRIGIKGKDIHRDERPVSNLVFLLDVSGSMQSPDKLALLQRGLLMMIDRLNENDKVSIVTYAGNAGVRLEPTSGDQKLKIRTVIERLAAGGSTNGSAGIEKAYALATENFIKGGTNRVILATDGDLNVGITDDQSLVKLISGKASEGVFLTVLGFGTGNLKDSKMEKLADNGNGVYAYIDSIREARKVLVDQMSSSLVTIAKDVKLQIDFNPTEVKAYRLLGYENRALANEDFANDQKDAGEIGAGHTVTALYEIVPAGLKQPATLSTQSKYQTVDVTPKENDESPTQPSQIEKAQAQLNILLKDYVETIEKLGTEHSSAKALNGQIIELRAKLAVKKLHPGEMLTLGIRFKEPESNTSTLQESVLKKTVRPFYEASRDFRFAAAVASFGMQLRHSSFRGQHGLNDIEKIASEAMGDDQAGYRAEFVDLVRQYANVIK